MSILERARASGKYPPSLLQDSSKVDEEFEKAVMKVLDANGTSVLRALVAGYHSICLECRDPHRSSLCQNSV